jgi:hypothetical protein
MPTKKRVLERRNEGVENTGRNNPQIQALLDEEVEDMHKFGKVLRCPNQVLIIDLCIGSYYFMVPGNYSPDNNTEYDNYDFYLLPNTTIDYKGSTSIHIIYHLELNSNKLDKFNHSVRKFDIIVLHSEVINRSYLDTIKTPFSLPNDLVLPRVPSRGRYDGSNSTFNTYNSDTQTFNLGNFHLNNLLNKTDVLYTDEF